MEFGISFFPNVGPEEKTGADYWNEALSLVDLCDPLGFSHVRTVEHYFHPYGGYSPNPMVFLAAASQRSKTARVVTGAVLPAFNNPLKLAGEAGMLDAISGGRLDLGIARAFLPHEFERFGVDLDTSRARYEEGIAQIKALLGEENVSSAGQFHSFNNVTSLPRPTQQPHPPIWLGALAPRRHIIRVGLPTPGVARGLMAALNDILSEFGYALNSAPTHKKFRSASVAVESIKKPPSASAHAI